MTTSNISVFTSNTEEYHQAFQVFLDHTDQKTKAREWLDGCIRELPSRRVFIDAGAGNGKVTAWFAPFFERTIAAEPNESLRRELETVCPDAEVHGHTILEAPISGPADFVLASHVFYYIPEDTWLENVARLASWLSPQGVLAVVIQHHQTDCMKMLRHFLGRSFDLRLLAESFRKQNGSQYEVNIETVPARIETPTFEAAFTIAEFMLNLLPLERPPARRDVEEYVRRTFVDESGGYAFTCSQDFLKIRPAAKK
jgi:hypothetical protein